MSEEKFINPLDLQPDVAVGVKLPFTQTNGRLFELSYSTAEQAHSNLRSLLLTRKGERRMQPRFGTDIYRYLMEPNTRATHDKLATSIKKDVEYWLPYISLDDVIITNKEQAGDLIGNTMYVSLKYNIVNQESETEIVLYISNEGIRIL